MNRKMNRKQTAQARVTLILGHAILLFGAAALLVGCERPPIETEQGGFRGTGMVDVQNPRTVAGKAAGNLVPVALPAVPEGGPAAATVYKNVKVLGNLSVGEFTRTMVAMTNWVAPKEGCAYCHNPADMASDEKYTKRVSLRMIQMTQHVNASWKTHVADTGVTCHTCHRGQPVPSDIWFATASSGTEFAGNKAGQNAAAPIVGLTSLPNDPFSTFLEGDAGIRTVSTTALPTGNRSSIKQTEWTYGLMMHMSQSLGVNCTYCHNSRSFTSWDSSPPARAVAWHGIRMVRDLNQNYLIPLKDSFPTQRLGPAGDGPKLYCATCHQGAAKPLNGAKMVGDYPALKGPIAAPIPVAAPPLDDGPVEGESAPEEESEAIEDSDGTATDGSEA
ncbi:MAG: photosynthetic reaction center cytochrome PufC [Panacagrimonas sp.]